MGKVLLVIKVKVDGRAKDAESDVGGELEECGDNNDRVRWGVAKLAASSHDGCKVCRRVLGAIIASRVKKNGCSRGGMCADLT